MPEARGSAASSSTRRERDAERAEAAAEAFLESDKISSLQELTSKLDRSCLPSGVFVDEKEGELYLMGIKSDPLIGPKVTFSLVINEALEIVMHCNGVKLPVQKVHHITGMSLHFAP